MAIMRKDNKERYTVVDNGITRDDRLSLKDFGLLVQLLSKPDNWNFSEAGLMRIFKQDGQTSIRTALKNLEKYRYLKRRKLRDDRGRIIDVEWIISETPMSEEDDEKKEQENCDYPFFENHNLENPNLEKPRQYNNKEFKTKESNMDKEDDAALSDASSSSSQEKNISEIIQYLNKKLNTRYRQNNYSIAKLITARLEEGYTVEDCKKVIDNKHKAWFGTQYAPNLKPKILFSEKHFDNYLNELPAETSKQQNQQRTNKFQNFEERNWDFAAIEQAILKDNDEPNDGIITNYRPEPNNADTTTKPKPQQRNSLADMLRKDNNVKFKIKNTNSTESGHF